MLAANAIGGVKVCPQNKDISDNWPEWYEGLNNDFLAYASACNGEALGGERDPIALFPQPDQEDRFHAREEYVLQKTEENSTAIGRPDLSGNAFKVGYYDMAYLQILWSQNETRLFPNALGQKPLPAEAIQIARGKELFSNKVSAGGAGCADCHHNGNVFSNGVLDDTFQDYNIHEPGVISEATVDGKGPFYRPENDYFFTEFGRRRTSRHRAEFQQPRHQAPAAPSGTAVPRLAAPRRSPTALRGVACRPPDSPLLQPGERGFNFRTVRTDHESRGRATTSWAARRSCCRPRSRSRSLTALVLWRATEWERSRSASTVHS